MFTGLWTAAVGLFLPCVLAYFGVSSIHRLPITLAGPLSCTSFNLASRQMDECGKGGVSVRWILTESLRQSALACQQQFRYERWNCTLTDGSRRRILHKAFSETAFLFAVSSAALVHAFARGCSSGALPQCSCDVSDDPKSNRETWLWGGCGDNVRYAQRYVRRFLLQAGTRTPHHHHQRKGGTRGRNQGKSQRRPKPRDLRGQVHRHNTLAGIKATVSSVRRMCKCHGVSGSCTTQTCWRKLLDFEQIGMILKQQYDDAILHRLDNTQLVNRGNRPQAGVAGQTAVTNPDAPSRKVAHKSKSGTNRGWKRKNGKIKSNKKRSRKNLSAMFSKLDGKLVYLDRSPSFCTSSNYSSGTRGRRCSSDVNCDTLCCGRGYSVSLITHSVSCCRLDWCCAINCKECLEEERVFICN